MSFPWRAAATASNKPNASTAYNIGTTLAGHRAPATALTDGDTVVLLAQSADRTVWEIYSASVYTDAATDTFSRAGTLTSSSGSAIDWSATGQDETPELHVLERVQIVEISSAVASVEFDGLFEAGLDYDFRFQSVGVDQNSTGVALWMRTKPNGGSFESGASDYMFEAMARAGGSYAPYVDNAENEIALTGLSVIGSSYSGYDNNCRINGRVMLHNPRDSGEVTGVNWQLGYGRLTSLVTVTGYGYRNANQDVVGVQFLPSVGNLDHGRIVMTTRRTAG